MVLRDGVSTISAVSHPNITVTKDFAAEPKIRQYYHLDNMSPTDELGINNGDIKTCERALNERMYYCKVDGKFVEPPSTSIAGIKAQMLPVTKRLKQLLFKATPVKPEEFLALYRGPLLKRYSDAYEEYKQVGLLRRHAFSSCFVKIEKVNISKAPRVIQPRHPVYNLNLGTYIKPIEHRIYKVLARLFGDGPTVMKGYDTMQVANIIKGKFNSFVSPCAIGLDATKFDMHVMPGMLNFEHDLYRYIYNNDAKLNKMLLWQMNNFGVSYAEDGKLKYKVRGKRFSGDMNTALGNCIIMCSLIWLYASERNIHVKLVNNGDDCVVFLEQTDEMTFKNNLDQWFLEKGFRMVAETPVYRLEQVEFCQMNPIYNGTNWNMCRNPHAVLAKDVMALKAHTPAELRAWLGAIGTGGGELYGDMPILGEIYKFFLRNGETKSKSYKQYVLRNDGWYSHWKGSNHLDRSRSIVTEESRVSFWEAFGVTPTEQIYAEQALRKRCIGPPASQDISLTDEILTTKINYAKK